MMKAVIVEDEILAAQSLQGLIHEVDPGIEVLTVLQSIDESVEWFSANPAPDLVFMDIHLADGSSFNIFDEVNLSCPIIFTTAYDEYALKAFEVNSIAYLLKPINKKDLERAITKYKNFSFNPAENSKLLSLLLTNIRETATPSYRSHFLVPEKDKLVPLPSSDIAFIYIDSRMVKAVTLNQKTYYLDQTLDDVMMQLDPGLFFRANRQFIIARKAIKDLAMWFGNKMIVNLTTPTPEKIVVSKAKVAEVKKWISGK